MTNKEVAAVTAELEATRKALQAAREELESARGRENKLLDTLKGQANALSATNRRAAAMRPYAEFLILLAIAVLAAWQVYLTLQLQVLLT